MTIDPNLSHEDFLKSLLERLQKDTVPQLDMNELLEPAPPFEGKVAQIYVDKAHIRVEQREVDFVASTPEIDADGDIVEQDFIFERFLKNPIILFGHNSRALPIGQAKNVRVEGGVLRLTVVFASKKANPLAENVFQLIKEEILRAMSIGFIPHDIRIELRDDRDVFVLSQNELIEASVVPIPSNQNALVDAKSKAMKAFKAQPGSKQTALGGRKKAMDEKEFNALQEKFDKLEISKKEIEDKNKKLESELAAQKERYTSLEELYTTEKTRANEAELSNTERDIDALVGKKIAPSEKPSLLKMAAALSREDFAEHMKSLGERPDMNLTTPTVLPKDAPQESTLPAPNNGNNQSGEEFASFVNKTAGLSS